MNDSSIREIPTRIEKSEAFGLLSMAAMQNYGVSLSVDREAEWWVRGAQSWTAAEGDDMIAMEGEPRVEDFRCMVLIHNEGQVINTIPADSDDMPDFMAALDSVMQEFVVDDDDEIEFDAPEDQAKMVKLVFEGEEQSLLLRPHQRIRMVVESTKKKEPPKSRTTARPARTKKKAVAESDQG